MKKEKKVTPFFNEMVVVYFQFFEKKFDFKPSFDGSSPRDLKNILESMKSRSEEKGFEWTEELSGQMLNAFLEQCYQDVWLKDNFLLFNLNRQKDKIFLKLKSKNNGSVTDFSREGLAEEFKRRYSS
jgi:hypothetical protein